MRRVHAVRESVTNIVAAASLLLACSSRLFLMLQFLDFRLRLYAESASVSHVMKVHHDSICIQTYKLYGHESGRGVAIAG